MKNKTAKSAKLTRPVRRTGSKAAGAQQMAKFIDDKPAWRIIDIIKLPGSARCSGLTVESQQQTSWCWAAVSNSASRFYDATST